MPNFTHANVQILSKLQDWHVLQQIESCARVCYRSEGKITSWTALPFVEKLISRNHLSTLEMAIITFEINCFEYELDKYFKTVPLKYIQMSSPRYDRTAEFSNNEIYKFFLTGSIRAFVEWCNTCHSISGVVRKVAKILYEKYPFLLPLQEAEKPCTFNYGEVDSVSAKIINLRKSEKDFASLSRSEAEDHTYIHAKFKISRATSHQLVRHREGSFLQESQRFVRYNGEEIEFIIHPLLSVEHPALVSWVTSMTQASLAYDKLLESKVAPQVARSVLPNSTATTLIACTNLSNWKHIINLRTSKEADPEIRTVMTSLKEQLVHEYKWLIF